MADPFMMLAEMSSIVDVPGWFLSSVPRAVTVACEEVHEPVIDRIRDVQIKPIC